MENSDFITDREPAPDAGRGARKRFRPPRTRLVVGGALMVLALVATTATASGSGGPGSGIGSDPILGSWYAQVYFPGAPFPGRTEATMMTFVPGGGLIEANPINASPAGNSGFWSRNPDGTYHLRLLNITWDPATSGTKQLLDVDITFVLQDGHHFHSTEASAVVYSFDSKTGERLVDPITVPDVTQTTAERFDTWKVPAQFPAEP